MQISVTDKKLKNKRKSKLKSAINLILIFLFAFISSAVLIVVKKKNLAFDEREIYFVSVASSKKESELATKSELLKNLGGSNLIYHRNNSFFLIANVYLNLADAEEIKANLISYFPETEVLKVKTKAVSKKSRKEIKGSEFEKMIKYLFKLSKQFQNIQMGYLSGKMNEGELVSSLVRSRLELEKLAFSCTEQGEAGSVIKGFVEIFTLQMSNFLTGFSISGSKQNYVCNYFVGFYMNFIEMYDCL